MSGIVGFVNLDGEPASSEILQAMLQPLRIASPDATGMQIRGAVALGHAALATTPDRRESAQPVSRDGERWLTADSCLCGKDELARRLRAAGFEASADTEDADLLALACRAFGNAFAAQLLGDFAVAVWDEPRQTLVCARDHLGVRPFFYSHSGSVFAFGSDIDALLAHPGISRDLDEGYLAEFLLFGSCVEPTATAYSNIRRLPAAHTLEMSSRGLAIRRYWKPPLHRTIRYGDPAEYTLHFSELFQKAVTQRMPEGPVALDLSGGMDSSSIAAVATAHARENGHPVVAYTDTCQTLIPEEREGQLAGDIAEYLNIPIFRYASEDYPLFDRFDDPRLRTAEPFANPGLARHFDKAQHISAAGGRVMLTGQMGDTLFAGSTSYLPHLLKAGRLLAFGREAYAHWRHIGTLRGTGLRAMLRDLLRRGERPQAWQPELPEWINPDFAERTDLLQRWDHIWRMWSDLNDVHGQLSRPWFSQFFESYDSVRLPLAMRHPFSDLRLVEYMLAIPGFMHEDKRVLREAMQGRLPEMILSRPKEGLPGDLKLVKMQRGLCRPVPPLDSVAPYVQTEQYRKAYRAFVEKGDTDTTWSSWLINGPIALAYWINNNRAECEMKRS